MTGKFVFIPQEFTSLKNQYDAVIIGSGATGLVAALQARELGMRVVVLEKLDKLGGNTNRASSGMNAAETYVQSRKGIVDEMDKFYQETYQAGGKMNDQNLLRYFVSHAGLAVDWLAAHSIFLNDLTVTGAMSIKRTHRPTSMVPIGGFLITELLKVVQRYDIPVVHKTSVTELVQVDGKICGVKVINQAGQEKTIVAKAVLLATGGFGAGKEIIAKYRPDLLAYKTTNHEGATGDGLVLAQKVGAQLVDMNLIQVHPTVQQDQPHAFLIGEAVRGEGAILVNQKGRRFVNELDTRKVVSNAITSLPEQSAYLVLDQSVRNRVKAIEFYDKTGLVENATSLEELAEKIRMPVENLMATAKRYNELVAKGEDEDFGRNMSLHTLEKGPFTAIHIAPAVHYTMGGIHITDKTEVLDSDGKVITGLFAAGEVAGGLHGNNRVGGNSIAETVVFGMQAGRQMKVYTDSLKR